jgi:hypothetical protein
MLGVVVLLLTLQWNIALVLLAGALSILTAAISLQDGAVGGGCPTCRARPSRQERDELSTVVDPSGESWLVRVTVDRLCTNCRESRRLVEELLIPRQEAATEAEAIVLARSGRFLPKRIRTVS